MFDTYAIKKFSSFLCDKKLNDLSSLYQSIAVLHVDASTGDLSDIYKRIIFEVSKRFFDLDSYPNNFEEIMPLIFEGLMGSKVQSLKIEDFLQFYNPIDHPYVSMLQMKHFKNIGSFSKADHFALVKEFLEKNPEISDQKRPTISEYKLCAEIFKKRENIISAIKNVQKRR